MFVNTICKEVLYIALLEHRLRNYLLLSLDLRPLLIYSRGLIKHIADYHNCT